MRFRTTVRGDGVELRGFVDVDSMDELYVLSEVAKPLGLFVASPADDDYNPFAPIITPGLKLTSEKPDAH